MARKEKGVEAATNEVQAATSVVATNTSNDMILDELDFNELFELERVLRQTEGQHDKVAGSIQRLKKDLEFLYGQERVLSGQVEEKRKELIKRYDIDEKRAWKIEIETRKIVYQG